MYNCRQSCYNNIAAAELPLLRAAWEEKMKRPSYQGKQSSDFTEKSSPVSGRKHSPASSGRRSLGSAGRQTEGKKARTQPLFESFGHAFDGIRIGVTERNMKIHCLMAFLVVVFGILLRISVTEWCICLVLFGLIMGLELVNTAVEAVVDMVTEEYHPLAKRAKDTAAGAVLIAAVMAAAVGLIIFIPRLLAFFREVF